MVVGRGMWGESRGERIERIRGECVVVGRQWKEGRGILQLIGKRGRERDGIRPCVVAAEGVAGHGSD